MNVKRWRPLFAAVLLSRFMSTNARADSLDDRINELLTKRAIPGLSLAVFKNGTIIRAHGYGLKEEGNGLPVTAETLFQAGSVSKPVATLGALWLVQTGKLSLDADINFELTSWKVPGNKFTDEKKVTLRMLLSHSAGMTVYGFPGYSVTEKLPTLTDILEGRPPANTPAIVVDVLPGSIERYSGGGFTVVQQAMIDVSGEKFPVFMQRHVLEPLGMQASSYLQPMAKEQERLAASGKSVSGHWHVYPEMAAAGLWTTPSDLARFAISLQEGEKGHTTSVLKPGLIQVMLTKQKDDVGLGIFLKGNGNSQWFEHNGRDEGFDTYLVASLLGSDGAVIMINANDDTNALTRIAEAIADTYGWPDYPHRQEPVPIADTNPAITTQIGVILEQIRVGSINEKLFSPKIVEVYSTQRQQLQRDLKRFGALRNLNLIKVTPANGGTIYIYQGVFENDKILLRCRYNKDQIIAAFDFHAES